VTWRACRSKAIAKQDTFIYWWKLAVDYTFARCFLPATTGSARNFCGCDHEFEATVEPIVNDGVQAGVGR
jgi:hypothetical protein